MLIAVISTSVPCVCCAALLIYIGGARMALAHCAMNQRLGPKPDIVRA